jgi:phytoene dehydrogenase-like protein
VYEKVVVWTLVYEILVLDCGSMPLTVRFLPPIGGFLYRLRPGTMCLAPWPTRVPLTAGTTRTPLDVLLYVGVVASGVVLLLADPVTSGAYEACRKAGTVHVSGTLEEVATAQREIAAGRMPERPFVLLSQQYLADPSRSSGSAHPVWAYAHVPTGYSGDATPALLDQIERFAPGTRERILDVAVRTPAAFEQYNANYVGGDIVTGANDVLQVAVRPRLALDPYSTGARGVFLCSAATPPGAGVHGMCGANAAASALRHLGV